MQANPHPCIPFLQPLSLCTTVLFAACKSTSFCLQAPEVSQYGVEPMEVMRSTGTHCEAAVPQPSQIFFTHGRIFDITACLL